MDATSFTSRTKRDLTNFTSDGLMDQEIAFCWKMARSLFPFGKSVKNLHVGVGAQASGPAENFLPSSVIEGLFCIRERED